MKAVFLDRDGVINRVMRKDGRPHPPASMSDLELLSGVPEAVQALRQAGFRVIVVTNQPDVATGVQRRETVEAMHAYLLERIDVDAVKVCFHVDGDRCACRKPKPGLLLQAAEEWDIDLTRSYMIGDRWRDIEAGRAAGCKTILVGRGYAEQAAKDPNAVADSLQDATAMILAAAI